MEPEVELKMEREVIKIEGDRNLYVYTFDDEDGEGPSKQVSTEASKHVSSEGQKS